MRLTKPETRCALSVGIACIAGLTACADRSPRPIADADLAAGSPIPCAEILTADGDDGEAVELSIQWAGSWDDLGGPALLENYSTHDPSVEVKVLAAVLPAESVSALTSQAPPVLARVPIDAVSALVAAELIRPFGACIDDAVKTQVLPAQEVGVIGEDRYAVVGNLDVKVMLFDRELLGRAGLDPSKPPSTLAELYEAGRTIRDELGIERPIASLSPVLSVWDQDDFGVDLPDGVETWLEMQFDGLLRAPDERSEFPPLGDGAAAIQIVNHSELWSYASALAAGQSPLADIGVAPIPGSVGPFVPIGREVWVLSAQAEEQEVLAANAFLAWLLDGEQQSAFHRLTDLFPAGSDGVSNARNSEYWNDLPLLQQAWEVVLDHAMPPPEWIQVPGAAEALQAYVTQSATVTEASTGWVPIADILDHAAATPDAGQLLACIYGNTGPPMPVTACSEVDGG